MRPAVRLSGALLLGLVLYLYGATSEVAWLFLVAFWVGGLAVAAYAYSRWNAAGLEGRVAPAIVARGPDSPAGLLPESLLRSGPLPEPVFEGDTLGVRAELRSRQGSRGPARLRGLLGGEELGGGLGRVPPTWTEAGSAAAMQRRGVVPLSGWRLESGDPFGLFVHAAALPDERELVVLPRFAELGGAQRQRELETSLPARRAGAGTELFGVREYRPGDALRRIHWRSSARHGELIVREFEPPGLRSLTLVLDPDPPSRDAADQAARLAASEAWDAWRSGGQVFLRSPGLRGTRSREARSFWALLEWLGRYPELEEDEGAAAPAGGEVVAVATRPGGAALTEAVTLAGRAGEVRAWLVGFEAELAVPARSTGLRWPL